MEKAPLWLVSDDRLAWLIDNKRSTKHFRKVLAMILSRTFPSRQERILQMLQMSPIDAHQQLAELSVFEDARCEDGNPQQWQHDGDERKTYQRIKDSIRERRVDVKPSDIWQS